MDFIEDLKAQFATYYDKLIELLPKLGLAIIITLIFLLVVSTLRRKLVRFVGRKADDKLLIKFTNNVFRTINIIIATLLFLAVLGYKGVAGSILGAATVSSFIIGFALKDIGENFLAGIILAFDRPFRLGDTIQTGNITGSIVEMSLRDIHIKTFDGKDVYVPSGQIIKNPLFNYTIDGFLRKDFTIGLDYDTDIEQARKVILEEVKKVPGILTEAKPPATLVNDFGASTVNIKVQYWINTFDKDHSSREIQSQAMNNVLLALGKAGVNLPGDIIELKNYKDRPLKSEPKIEKGV